jgi:orotate phosphoribosyltransferase-like protein
MLCSSLEYFSKNVFLEKNKVREENKKKGIFYSNFSYLHKKREMIGDGLIGFYVPL